MPYMVPYSQAAANGLGWQARPIGAADVQCGEDTFLFKFEKTKDASGAETGMCTKKIKPAPIIIGVVALAGIGWFLLRKKK